MIGNEIVEAVYEVKSQDYILDKGFKINEALLEIWNNKQFIRSFVTQDGKEYMSTSQIEGHLILFVGPNDYGIKKYW